MILGPWFPTLVFRNCSDLARRCRGGRHILGLSPVFRCSILQMPIGYCLTRITTGFSGWKLRSSFSLASTCPYNGGIKSVSRRKILDFTKFLTDLVKIWLWLANSWRSLGTCRIFWSTCLRLECFLSSSGRRLGSCQCLTPLSAFSQIPTTSLPLYFGTTWKIQGSLRR